MQLHNLKRNTTRKKTRVGRGGKRGKTSGKGHKGQNARGTPRPAIRDVIKKIPKKRGYNFKGIKEKPIVINLSLIDEKFSDGETVSFKTLSDKKIIKIRNSKISNVKILSDGDITKKIIVDGCLISEKALEKIKKAGGEVKNTGTKTQNKKIYPVAQSKTGGTGAKKQTKK